MNYPFVTALITTRNEEEFINKCLDSLIANDYPKNKLEILVIDGISKDKTQKIVKEYSKKYSFIKLIENPKIITSAGWNIGIKQAQGEIIVIFGAHATYSPTYISKSVKHLQDYNADAVGGALKAIPANNTLIAKVIALSLSHVFSSGPSYRSINKIAWVDTVFGGCYKKEIFQKIGFYNQNLVRSSDMDFNIRLKKGGGKILFAPDIVTNYYPKSTFKEFFRHNIRDGIWAIYPLKFRASLFKFRHLAPLFFVLSILISAIIALFLPLFTYVFIGILTIYFLTSLSFSLQIAAKEKEITLIPFLIISFAIRHFGYGIGSVIGLIKLLK